jgi:alcohol dehydrogenase YqhD (iron-dependent ADH family)
MCGHMCSNMLFISEKSKKGIVQKKIWEIWDRPKRSSILKKSQKSYKEFYSSLGVQELDLKLKEIRNSQKKFNCQNTRKSDWKPSQNVIFQSSNFIWELGSL